MKDMATLGVLVFFGLLLGTTVPVATAQAADKIEATRFKTYSCNAVSFVPIPGRDGWFIGRRLIPTDPNDGCRGQFWTLVLVRKDTTSHQFVEVHDVLKVPARIQGGVTLSSGFDAAVALIDGAYWIAFECSGMGIFGSSTCIGPFVNDQIDTSRVYVIVIGNDLRERPYTYSASAPKFLQYDGGVYLYWSAIKMQNAPWHWLSISTRGMALTYDPDRALPLLPKNAMGPVRAFDPSYNVRVWDSADMYSIQPWNGRFIATAAATSLSCLKPSDAVPGCYHLIIGVSPRPLAVDGFEELKGLQAQLPANQASYVRLNLAGDEHASIIGQFGPPPFASDRDVTPGIEEVPITLP